MNIVVNEIITIFIYLNKKIGMVTVNDAIKFNEIAEKIFGYYD